MAIDRIDADGVSDNLEIGGTEAAKMPNGTTAQRANVSSGDIRFNTTLNLMEYYDGTNWKSIDAPPQVSSISPTTATAANTTITLSGTNFQSGATVKFIGNDGTEYNSPTVTFVSSAEITATTPTSALTVANEPYDVQVTNPSGLTGVLSDGLDAGGSPTWTTSSGNLATIWDRGDDYSPIATIAATDPDGQSVTYTETTSVLSGAGLSLGSSNGQITGNPTDVTNQETKTFSVDASDGTNTTNRTFNIIINPNPALLWYKSEDITDTGSAITWANSGSLGSDENMTSFGTYSNLQYTASDSDFGNNKTIGHPDNTTKSGLATPTGIDKTVGDAFTLLCVMRQRSDSLSNLGESGFGWSSNQSNNNGDWMFDTGGDHSWGGSYGEFRGTGSPDTSNAVIVMWRFAGGSGGAWNLRRMGLSDSTWTAVANGTDSDVLGDVSGTTYERFQILDNYDVGAGSSHHFDGKIAEVVWIGSSISDTHSNYWRDYFKEKFG